MATPTSMSHPLVSNQTKQFYPYEVTIKSLTGEVLSGPFPCAYDAATGGEPGTFEDEAPSSDKILIPSWAPDIPVKAQAILSMVGIKKKFEISDVLPQGVPPTKTLLIVSPP